MKKTYMSSIHDCLAESLNPTKAKAEGQKPTGVSIEVRSLGQNFPRTLAVNITAPVGFCKARNGIISLFCL